MTIAYDAASYCYVIFIGVIIENFISLVHFSAENNLGLDLKSIICVLLKIETYSQSINSLSLSFCFVRLLIISSKDGVYGYSHSVVKESESPC